MELSTSTKKIVFGVATVGAAITLLRMVRRKRESEKSASGISVQLASRCTIGNAPEQKIFGGDALPLILQAREGTTLQQTQEWVTSNQPELENLLLKHGAVLFRGFPLNSSDCFSQFVKSFKGWNDLPYEDSLSYAVRVAVCDRVCTTNEGKTGGMVFHHEQAQAPRYPSKVMFYCQNPATSGGGTGVCRSDVLLNALEKKFPDFIKQCEAKGVKYIATLPAQGDTQSGVGRSWKSFFGRETKEETEKRMTELGYTWTWLQGDALRTCTPVLDAVRKTPNGRRVFFNQMLAQYIGNAKEFAKQDSKSGGIVRIEDVLQFGDGSKVDPAPLEYGEKVCAEHEVTLQWQKGDVGLLDNFMVMHARRAFEGPRKVMASLVQ